MAIAGYYASIKPLFPACRFVFAYGSAAYQQLGKPLGKMLDFIFVVDNPCSWHSANLAVNSSHYSGLRHLGPATLGRVQGMAAGVYFNPLVCINDKLIKYGVVSEQVFLEDLHQWKTLYISGRLHKPVVMLEGCDDMVFQGALLKNLTRALRTTLILLPDQFSAEELFMAVAGLSFMGDFRMIVGEDRNKVRNIVRPHLGKFHKLYSSSLREAEDYVTLAGDWFHQDASPQAVRTHLEQLPMSMHRYIPPDSAVAMGNDRREVQRAVVQALRHIVGWSSLGQSVKGILTAGPMRSMRYAAQKMGKMLRLS